MCLVSKSNEPLIAVHDIHCYKALKKLYSPTFNRDEFFSPFQHSRYYLNAVNYASLHTSNFDVIEHPTGEKFYYIREGFLHCFTDKGISSLNDDDYNFTSPFSNLSLFECYIPKGSKYFISEDGKEICSNKLYVTNIYKELKL